MRYFFIILSAAILFTGCSVEGDLKIINQTNHNLYFNIKNTDYILNGNESTSLNFNLGKKFIFWGDDSKKYALYLEGETFMMQGSDNYGNPTGDFCTETTIEIESGKTKTIYTSPTHAGFKIFNNAVHDINNLCYRKIDIEDPQDFTTIVLADTLEPGTMLYDQIPYTNTSEPEFRFVFIFDYDEETFTYSLINDEYIILGKDEQFVINFE